MPAAARILSRLLESTLHVRGLESHGTACSSPARKVPCRMFRRHETRHIYIDFKSGHLREGHRWKWGRTFDTIFDIGHWGWGVSQRQQDAVTRGTQTSAETLSRCSCWGPQWAKAGRGMSKLMDLPLLWLPHWGLCLTLLIYWTDIYWAPAVCKAVLMAWVAHGTVIHLVPVASVFCYHGSSSYRILKLGRRKSIVRIWTNMEN